MTQTRDEPPTASAFLRQIEAETPFAANAILSDEMIDRLKSLDPSSLGGAVTILLRHAVALPPTEATVAAAGIESLIHGAPPGRIIYDVPALIAVYRGVLDDPSRGAIGDVIVSILATVDRDLVFSSIGSDPASRNLIARLADELDALSREHGVQAKPPAPIPPPVARAPEIRDVAVEAPERARTAAAAEAAVAAERPPVEPKIERPERSAPPSPPRSRGGSWWQRVFYRPERGPTRSWRPPTRKYDPQTGEPIGPTVAPPPGAARPPMAAPEPPSAGPAAPTYRAYGLLESNETVLVAKPFELKVGLSPAAQAGVAGTSFELAEPEDEADRYDVDVQLFADGFDLAPGESWRNSLTVKSKGLYPTITLHLTARDLAETMKDREISATFSIQGETLGTATREIRVTKDPKAVELQAPAAPAPGANITAPTGQPPAHVTIIIKQGLEDGSLLWGVESPLAGVGLPHDRPARSVVGEGDDPKTFAAEIIKKVFLAGTQQGLDELLEGIGRTIQDAVPVEVQNAIKAAQAAVAPRTLDVLLLTAEPYIPWELAWQEARFDPEAPNYLGAQVNLGRWILDPSGAAATDPPRHVSASTMAVVSGVYKSAGLPRLLAAEEEAKEIEGLYKAAAIDAEPPLVYPLLKGTPPSDILHFAVHGRYNPEGTDEGIYLVSGPPIDPFRIRGSNLRDRSPFVFLNACQVGSASNLLGRYGGIAQAFLKVGASAVVAPLWSIDDKVAKQIALEFYERALSSEGVVPGATDAADTAGAAADATDDGADARRPAVAALLREARAGFIKKPAAHSSTYLAYQFYGHPSLRLTWKPA